MRIAVLALLVSIGALAAGLGLTLPDLPERVASHFGADGMADGWTTRAAYARTLLTAAALVSAALAGSAWLLSIPACDRWWNLPRRPAPEQWPALRRLLRIWGLGMAAGACWFVLLLHLATVQANHQDPPRLGWPAGAVLVFALGGTIAGGVALVLAVKRRLRG